MKPASCPDRKQLCLLVDDLLTTQQKRAIDAHLPHCEHCLATLESLTSPLEMVDSPTASRQANFSNSILKMLSEIKRSTESDDQRDFELNLTQKTIAFSPNDHTLHENTLFEPTIWVDSNIQLAEVIGLSDEINRYRIVRELGKGGMGAVYLAEDSILDRLVAIKLPYSSPCRSEILHRFETEAKILAKLQHPNICPIYDVAKFSGHLAITMAYIDGHSLADYIRAPGKQPIRQSVNLIRKLAVALYYAHLSGVVHGDLKPANIMIDKRKEPVITDFGLANRQTETQSSPGAIPKLMGTPSYMAPEQIDGSIERLTETCDIYSLGAVLFELLTGRPPFIATNLQDLILKICNNQPVPPSSIRYELPLHLDLICKRALEKKPGDRFSSMKEFANALTDYLNGNPEVAEKTVSTIEPTVSKDEPVAEPFKAWRWVGLVAAIPFFGLLIWWINSSRPTTHHYPPTNKIIAATQSAISEITLFDINDDQKLSLGELRAIYKLEGMTSTESRRAAEEDVRQFDSDKDGLLSTRERVIQILEKQGYSQTGR